MRVTIRCALAAITALASLWLTSQGRAEEVVSSYVTFTDLTIMMTAIPPISGLMSFPALPSTLEPTRILAPTKGRAP